MADADLPTLPASSDDGELTDSDEEKIANVATPVDARPPDSPPGEQVLTAPPQLPVIAVDTEPRASSSEPQDDIDPPPTAPKLTLLERLKQMKFGKPGAAKVDLYMPPTARISRTPRTLPPMDIEAPQAPVMMTNRSHRRQAVGRDWDTPDSPANDENAFDECVRSNRYRDDEMMQPQRMSRQRGGRRDRRDRRPRHEYYDDNAYGYDDEPFQRSPSPRRLTPPPRPATPPPLTYDEIEADLDALSFDYAQLDRCDWAVCKQAVVRLRASNATVVDELNECDKRIAQLQVELQSERAELNLPPSRNVMRLAVPGESLIAAKDVPSVFSAAAWDPLAPIEPTNGTAMESGSLAQVLGLLPAAPPPAQRIDVAAVAMSTNSFVQSITKMFVLPPPNMMGTGQGSISVAPSVNANIAHPHIADDSHTTSEMKRPRAQLTLRQGGLKRAFRKKPSMLANKPRRPLNANMTPVKTRRRVDEWMEKSTENAMETNEVNCPPPMADPDVPTDEVTQSEETHNIAPESSQ